MPAPDPHPLAELLIVFERSSRVLERHVARDGDRAAAMAALLRATVAPLQGGRYAHRGGSVTLNDSRRTMLGRLRAPLSFSGRARPGLGRDPGPVLLILTERTLRPSAVAISRFVQLRAVISFTVATSSAVYCT